MKRRDLIRYQAERARFYAENPIPGALEAARLFDRERHPLQRAAYAAGMWVRRLLTGRAARSATSPTPDWGWNTPIEETSFLTSAPDLSSLRAPAEPPSSRGGDR